MLMLLAEYASVHRDGTYSIVRGGIDKWQVKELPADLVGTLFFEIPPDKVQAGSCEMTISARDSQGSNVFEMKGQAEIGQVIGTLRTSVHFVGRVAVAGQMTIEAAIGLETARHVVNVILDPGAQ